MRVVRVWTSSRTSVSARENSAGTIASLARHPGIFGSGRIPSVPDAIRINLRAYDDLDAMRAAPLRGIAVGFFNALTLVGVPDRVFVADGKDGANVRLEVSPTTSDSSLRRVAALTEFPLVVTEQAIFPGAPSGAYDSRSRPSPVN